MLPTVDLAALQYEAPLTEIHCSAKAVVVQLEDYLGTLPPYEMTVKPDSVDIRIPNDKVNARVLMGSGVLREFVVSRGANHTVFTIKSKG